MLQWRRLLLGVKPKETVDEESGVVEQDDEPELHELLLKAKEDNAALMKIGEKIYEYISSVQSKVLCFSFHFKAFNHKFNS